MTDSPLRRAVRSPVAIDAALTLVVAVTAYLIAYRSLAGFSVVPWVDDLLVPCIGRPGWVPNPDALQALPQWQAFLSRQLEFFPCEALAGVPMVEVGHSWRQSEYFHRLLGLWFQLRGPTIDGFISFQSAFHAATCASVYLVFRLGLWRLVALAAVSGIAWSQAHLTAVAMPIEYAKAPWMLASVWLCGVVLRRDTEGRSLWAPSLALGLVAGVGIGFKTDLMAAVPLALMTTILFVRRAPTSPSRKGVATVCVLAGLALGGGSVLWRTVVAGQGSVLAVQFLGGLDGTTERRHVADPLYDYGLVFDDSHVTVLINSYARRVLGASEPMYFNSIEMQRASVALLRELWTTFPGDLVLRVIAATWRVMQLNGYGLVIAIAGLFVIFVRNLRAGWAVAVAIVFLSGYVSLVFQRRHFYHLEFISWGLSAALVQAVCMPHHWLRGAALQERWYGAPRRVLAAVVSLALIAGGSAALLAVARMHQQASVLALIGDVTRMTVAEAYVESAPSSDGGAVVRIDGISVADGEPDWPIDHMRADYAALAFECRDAAPITVTARYRPPAGAWDRTFSIACSSAATTSTLMVPIYQYGATYRFDGLLMSGQARDHLRSVTVVRPDNQTRLWLALRLPADWPSRLWFATMRMPLATP